jgi:hypothetical protein
MCCKYWPNVVGELAEFGEYMVDLITKEALDGFIVRTLSVLHVKVWNMYTAYSNM